MSKQFWILKRIVYLQNRIRWLDNILRKLTIGHIGKFRN